MAKAQNPPEVGDEVTVIDGNIKSQISNIWPDGTFTVFGVPDSSSFGGVYSSEEIILHNEPEY